VRRKKRERVEVNEETLWIPWNGEGERQLTFNETQGIIREIIEERGTSDPDERHRRLIEVKERLQTSLSLTSVLVKVKGGKFRMGSNKGSSYEKPVHTVILTYDYWIGKYAVTFAEYDTYCAAMGLEKPYDEGWGRWTRPVINVSWLDAIGYCNWLSECEELAKAYDNDGNLLDTSGTVTTDITQVEGYRLLTEAEWEYAARGGQKSKRYKYSGSNVLNKVGWYWQNSGDKWLMGIDSNWSKGKIDANKNKAHPVGQKKPNELGLYDLSGNVWEWCQDSFDSYNYVVMKKENPIVLSSGRSRMCRGGSWGFNAQSSRVSARHEEISTRSYNYLGFRLARTVF